jgi:hypothetical protein
MYEIDSRKSPVEITEGFSSATEAFRIGIC